MVTKKTEGRVSAREVRELCKLAWVRDEELSRRGSEARVLPDGRVFLFYGGEGAGTMFPSREALAEANREADAFVAKGPLDPTRKFLPPIADFLRDVEAHAKSLGTVIDVPEGALDFTETSLDVAYKAVLRLSRAKRETPEVYTPLVAYTGEVMRRISEGRWTTSPAGGNEPIIKGPQGDLLQPFALVLVELHEHGARGSLTGAVRGTLVRYLNAEKADTRR